MRKDQSSWTSKRPMRVLKERATSCIATQVLETVPSCAVSCVESFIQTEYSTSCANTSSLEYLCVTPNPSGFALGEAALRCVVSNCSSTGSEGLVYNICAGIRNAVPRTMATITATVQSSAVESSAPLPVTTTSLPTTIARPSTTQALSSFETATGSPSTVPPMTMSAPPTTLSTSSIPTPPTTTTSVTQASPETASTTAASVAKVHNPILRTSTVAGIAVGSIALAAAVFSILMFLFCLRKKRRTRRTVSQRWSTAAFPPPPPSKDTELAWPAPATNFSPNKRFYASPAPEERRRSFWRKSINPVDIGVAVSPGKMEPASPKSMSSEKSASGLLANREEPSMWPAPLINYPPPPKGIPRRPGNTVPRFSKTSSNGAFNANSTYSVHAPYETKLPRLPQQLTQASYSRPFIPIPRVSIQAPYETRLTRLPGPPPTTSRNQAHNADRARAAALTARIPLTPIYDNGNYATTSQGISAPNTNRRDPPETMHKPSGPVHQEAAQAPRGLKVSNAAARGALARTGSQKSMASDSTTFEDDTTTEEERDRQLRLAQAHSISQYSDDGLARIPEGHTSPIKDLAYPQVPRSASVSPNAQQVPRPLAGQNIHTAESSPVGILRGLSRRYDLNRAGQDYLVSETNSSAAGAPSLAQRRIRQQKDLRIKTYNSTTNALNSRWQVPTQPWFAPPVTRKPLPVETLLDRPSLKEARVTPKTNSRGDLFLTVED